MAYLKKRGKYYYAKWHTSIDGKKPSVRKALGTRHKYVAQKMLKELQELELLGKVDPFAPGFDPKKALKGGNFVLVNGSYPNISLSPTKGWKEREIPVTKDLTTRRKPL